ncbi:ribonucleoside-diphosphate reductase subunit alpha [Natronospirillum operosum]|uniref:Ribonucleoside-diphosphate reductase n=1 Tax=Natronospirillum operosum TaxID=2759953 RepID=A0A4Z0WDM4_9GAMM|nr:ribonucleoside-diphosphate reductase subunit alpha [Natronospirillum operosum]TGG92030.1 ribonucleoside-diphosphate reductase subunit alpha [Natronospirillum operosum]
MSTQLHADTAPPVTTHPLAERYSVIKRNNEQSPFEPDKIRVAVTQAFIATEGEHGQQSNRIREQVQRVVDAVIAVIQRRLPSGGAVHIEDIQDQVELSLMRLGEHAVARAYVLYRAEHAQQRAAGSEQTPFTPLLVTVSEGGSERQVPLDLSWFRGLIREACANLAGVDPEGIEREALKNLYQGVQQQDIVPAVIMTARACVEKEPAYSTVCARLLLEQLRAEALTFLDIAERASAGDMRSLYARVLPAFIHKGIELELLDERLADFDLKRLGQALQAERDLQFQFLGLQTLYDRYFIHAGQVRFELPQVFFMRIAMGLALNEDDREARAIEFYEVLSKFDYMASTPTLFNAGTRRPQLSSCYLTTVPDDLDGIYSAIRDNALLSKWAGGLGNDWSRVRALGAHIKGTNGQSQGIVPFLKVVNDTAVAVNQGGKRKGAVCAYLETWHLDVEEFLELRKNTGDDRRRAHDMNTAHWVPDLFMQRVFEDADWTLFSPSDVPDLHDLTGSAFQARYEAYERMTESGELTLFKRVSAKQLWRRMLSMLFETGHPWITFKDACNLRSPQQHAGVVHSSNLCTEITLNTSDDEIAVCNLGSVNLVQHLTAQGQLDTEKLRTTVRTAVRMLDNVIDINYYAVPQARNSNQRHRPVGLGLMGFQDALYKAGISYASEAGVDFADQTMEQISYFALEASSDLAAERGHYQSYPGSLWDQGILPIDSIRNLAAERGAQYLQQDTQARLDWAPLRDRISRQGMRNSNVMAIAPTATIANIIGVSASIEPTYQNLYVKSNLSGEFTVINPWLVQALKAEGVWDDVMVNDLKYFNGSVQQIDRVPDALKARFATSFELSPKWLVESASRRQKWLDQAQSLNLYIAEADGNKLDVTYRMAWLLGLKTTYYLRALGASGAEKSTVAQGELNAVQSGGPAPVPQACSIDDPDCEACQ